MISFRFHLVSLVAVFLALGLGVLTGTTVINRGIVSQLERQTDTLLRTSADLRARVDQLEAEAGMWHAFGDETMGRLVSGRLPGTQVVVLTQEAADGRAVDGVRRALDRAGAQLRAVFAVGRRMRLQSEGDRAALAEALRTSMGPAEQLQTRAAETLAARLAFGGGTEDVLARLLDAGFLVDQGPGLDGDGLGGIGGGGQVFVVVAGGRAPPPIEPDAFLVPLIQGLVLDGATLAAAEGMTSEYDFVRFLRGDGIVSARIVTQDNVDQVPGQVGLVLALEDLVEQGRPGHYGVKDGAARLIPESPGA